MDDDPVVALRTKCASCGHAFSFHGRTVGGPCRAMGCKAQDGQRCTGFEERPALSAVG